MVDQETREAPLQVTYRVAVIDDETNILAVFKEVAPEVPTVIGPNTESIIHECVVSGDSWVAVDPNGVVMGFALAKPDQIDQALRKKEAISLRYIGVSAIARGRGICSALIRKLKEGGKPVNATVLKGNESSMADRFIGAGFDKGEVGVKEIKFRWEKKATAS